MDLDFYCERIAAGFWGEPFNALSNVSFLVAGLWGFSRAKAQDQGFSRFLSGLCIAVGLGSFLFHTFASKGTHLLDLLPIFVFTFVFVNFTLRSILGIGPFSSRGLVALLVIVMAGLEFGTPKSILNGSLLYAPILALLAAVSIILRQRRSVYFPLFIAMTGIFFVSLVARTLDQDVCDAFPWGTHFVWHILNGACLALMIQVSLLREPTAPAGPSGRTQRD
ncbi:MAG: ceramidase domain-containing protein [Bdellovibrionales bacterium]